MLRSISFASATNASRRCGVTTIAATSSSVASSTILSAASLTSQQRDIVMFSQQSEALENAAKYKGYTSNVWFEEQDLFVLSSVGKLKPKQDHVETRGLRRIELYNADQLFKKPDDCPAEPQVHSSLRTGAGYSARFQRDLEEIAQKFNFQSKWWFSPREVSKRGLQMKRKGVTRPHALMVNSNLKCFNADQFDNAERVALQPISGMTRKVLGSKSAEVLVPVCQEKKFKTGLFFTTGQLEAYGLTGSIKADEKPVEMVITDRNSFGTKTKTRTFYNITEVENYEELLKQLGRFPIDHPSYLGSGKTIAERALVGKISHSAFKSEQGKPALSNYWLEKSDAEDKGFTLKSDAKGIKIEPKDIEAAQAAEGKGVKLLYYNADQLEDPNAAFKIAGSKMTKKEN